MPRGIWEKRNWFSAAGPYMWYYDGLSFTVNFWLLILPGKLICAVFIFFYKCFLLSDKYIFKYEKFGFLNRKCYVGYANCLYLIASLCSMVLINKFPSFEKNHKCIESIVHYWAAYGLDKYIIPSWAFLGFKNEKFVRNAYILDGWLESFQSFWCLMLPH